MDGLVGFELQQLDEGFPAVFAAQSLLGLTLTLLLGSTSTGRGLYHMRRSGGVSWAGVFHIFWLQLVVWIAVLILAHFISVLTRTR